MGESDYKNKLLSMNGPGDIPAIWKNTPVESLIGAVNWGATIQPSPKPQLLLCTCIEYRYSLPIPKMYAYVIRRATGRLVGSEFSIAYALSKGVKYLAIVGHDDCGMTHVREHGPLMIKSLIAEGWDPDRAEEFVSNNAARYIISDEIEALQKEFYRLKRLFRRVKIAPLFVQLKDTKLYCPQWYLDYVSSGAENLPAGAGSVDDEELLLLD